ncbi:hypothetical protein P3395_26075, partial [Vibrio parahaemolyticus]|nr:hypothetical protein [Vibrio parahaemolyticus]
VNPGAGGFELVDFELLKQLRFELPSTLFLGSSVLVAGSEVEGTPRGRAAGENKNIIFIFQNKTQ